MDKFEMWNSWGDIHNDADQRKRIESAKKANMTPVSVDENDLSGEFVGSAKYHVTLLTCNCSDFRRRGLPCKHIYRLAIELGLLDEHAKSDSSKIRTAKLERYSLKETVKKVESLTDKQRKILQDVMRQLLFVDTKMPAVIMADADGDTLINKGFLNKSSNTEAFFLDITRAELLERLDRIGACKISRNSKKVDVINFVKENVNDINAFFNGKYAVNLDSRMEGVQRKLYTYLLRRDEVEEYYDPDIDEVVKIPYGSDFVWIAGTDGKPKWSLAFPDDEVTWILNSLGLNRCDDWEI